RLYVDGATGILRQRAATRFRGGRRASQAALARSAVATKKGKSSRRGGKRVATFGHLPAGGGHGASQRRITVSNKECVVRSPGPGTQNRMPNGEKALFWR